MEDLLYDAANTDPESTVPCRALRYRKDLLDCAHTTTDEATTVDGRDLEYQALLSKAREWRSRLFFSKRKLEELFTKDQGKVIKNLWTCPCGRCRRNRDEKNRSGPDQANERNRIAKKGWLLLALLVYLNRVHLIHSWVNKMENWNSGLLHGGMRNFDNPPCLDETYFSPKQLRWFKAKYCHDAALFDPEVFTSESLGREYNDDARFPFTTVKPLSQDAERFPSSDIVYDITIPAEYVDNWVKHKLRGYHDACLKVPNGGEINPENAAVSRLRKPRRKSSTDNIISLPVFPIREKITGNLFRGRQAAHYTCDGLRRSQDDTGLRPHDYYCCYLRIQKALALCLPLCRGKS